jgi:ubiquinone/menaquinone biosynthesis C-methylase UbiE
MSFFEEDHKTAFEAKEAAQWIAFGPVIFQSARALRNTGILASIDEAGQEGITLTEIQKKVKLSTYGIRVLLESGLGMKLITSRDQKYKLAKTGYYILHDDLTKTNMDFVQDVCYRGLFYLDKSVESGKPEGLKEYGAWNTIYEALSKLPEHVQKSWFGFDHFFSDDAFPLVLKKVLEDHPRNMLDIGGNTGKWAAACARYDDQVHVTVMDLPAQLDVARSEIERLGLADRISFFAGNVLEAGQELPQGHDTIWMSQFLDCFSEEQIIYILKKCYTALNDDGCIYILEPFWDRQRFEVAAFCIQQTSLYFTALANGNSQLYHSEVFLRCIEQADFVVTKQEDRIGLSQTLLVCNKKMK